MTIPQDRFGIMDALEKAIEYKTGYQYLSADNSWEIQRDAALVKAGWDIQWVFRDTVSQPLLDKLDKAGIRHKIGDGK